MGKADKSPLRGRLCSVFCSQQRCMTAGILWGRKTQENEGTSEIVRLKDGQNWHNHTHKIKELAKHFENGTVPRKSAYRKRKNAAQKRYYRRHREKVLSWHKAHCGSC